MAQSTVAFSPWDRLLLAWALCLDGAAAYLSRLLGGDRDPANKVASTAITAAFPVGAVVNLFSVISLESIFENIAGAI